MGCQRGGYTRDWHAGLAILERLKGLALHVEALLGYRSVGGLSAGWKAVASCAAG